MLVLTTLACGGYWWQLAVQHRAQIAFAQQQAQVRTDQLARTLAAQMGTLMSGIEYVARNLAALYASDPQHAFMLAAANALETFPRASILQIAVASANGHVVYSSLAPGGGVPDSSVSIADRAHFLAHVTGQPLNRLYISRPTLGRLSGRWSIQVSYPVQRQGKFDGAVVLSIDPQYLSHSLREALGQDEGSALIVRADGSYLAGSDRHNQEHEQTSPQHSEFLQHPERTSGRNQPDTPAEGLDRIRTWQRLDHFPIVVDVSLAREQALSATYQAVRTSQWRNAAGTLAIAVTALWIAWLFHRHAQERGRLQRHKQRYRLALEGGQLGTWDWSPVASTYYFDRRWPRLLGLPAQVRRASPAQLKSLIHPDDWAAWCSAWDAHVLGHAPFFEAKPRLRQPGGQWAWLHFRGKRVVLAGSRAPARITGIYVDVTQQHALDAARQELQQRLSKLLAQVPGTVYQFRLGADASSCFPYASPGITDIFGMTPEQAQADAQYAFAQVHPQDIGPLRASIAESARQLSLWAHEWRQLQPNGETRWLSGKANPEREGDGSTLWHGYIHDVTQQHTVVDALRRSEARLRLTMAAVQDGLWEWDTGTDIITMDTRCHQMLGYAAAPEQLSFQDWKQRLHPDNRQLVLTTLQRQVALGQPFDVETRLLTQQGTWLWVEIRGQAAPHAEGDCAVVIGTQTDITLRMQEAHLRQALLDNAAAALLISTPERTIALANQRAVDTFSEDGLPLQGKSTSALHRHQGAFMHFHPYHEAVRQNGAVEVEYLLRTASGALRWFLMRGTLLDPQQPEGNIVWTLVDTTERRETEEALATAQAHLMEVIQHFPGGVLVQNHAGDALVLNQAMCDLFDIDVRCSDLIGSSRAALRALAPPEVLAVVRPEDGAADTEACASYEVALKDARTVRIDRVPMHNTRGDNLGCLWLAQDVTERRRHERTLERLATTDTLTGLANRRAFMARLEAEITHMAHGAAAAVFLMLDLDHFKRVNDTWGHASGDKVLIYLAQLLRGNLLRKEDLAGRLGGEEFAVLLPDTTLSEGLAVAERLRLALYKSPIVMDESTGQTVQVSMSVGVCVVGEDSASTLASADAALYEAKNTGRNKVMQAVQPGHPQT
jgi:diguanylate cyclase (GGDEF)-like protein/PAS domain S-box-containing protein